MQDKTKKVKDLKRGDHIKGFGKIDTIEDHHDVIFVYSGIRRKTLLKCKEVIVHARKR